MSDVVGKDMRLVAGLEDILRNGLANVRAGCNVVSISSTPTEENVMTDTLASLKKDLLTIGKKDYSLTTRMEREAIQSKIDLLENPYTMEQKARHAMIDSERSWIDAVERAYADLSVYGGLTPYKLTEAAKRAYKMGYDASTAVDVVAAYLESNPE